MLTLLFLRLQGEERIVWVVGDFRKNASEEKFGKGGEVRGLSLHHSGPSSLDRRQHRSGGAELR